MEGFELIATGLWSIVPPILALVLALITKEGYSSLTIGVFTGMIISTIDPAATVTAFNGCSSDLTLEIMLVVALVMVPIVLLYQFWAYRLFSHKLDADTIADEEHAY